MIDRLTLSILNRRILGIEDFQNKQEGGVRLEPAALRRYLTVYEHAMGDVSAEGNSPRERIRQSVEALRRAVMAGKTNEPTVEGCS